jgi:hypothetical protein
MRTFVADIIPRIQRFSKRLDDTTKLTNQHWVSISDIKNSKTVYIFDSDGDLDIFENGVGIDSGTWKFIDPNSLKLKLKNSPPLLLKHGFFDENVIALKLDSTDNYAFFVNETKYHSELNTIGDILKFLENKYLKNNGSSSGLGSTQKRTINENYSYTIISEKEGFDIVLGAHVVYGLEFPNGIKDKVYRGHSTGKFYYLDTMAGKVYCKSFEDAAYNVYISRKK